MTDSDELGPTCTLANVNMTLSLLLKDQLCVKQYARTIAAFGAYCDGSGGVIVWKDVESFGLHRREWAFSPYDADWFNYGREHYLHFDTNATAEQLQSVTHHPQTSWQGLKLPKRVLDQILEEALYFGQLLQLDLDTDTCFPFGPAMVRRAFYEKWWDLCGQFNLFKLRTSTNEARSCFSGFGALKRLMRKEGSGDEPSLLLGPGIKVNIFLDFKLKTPTPLADLHVSILPFVLETSVLSDLQQSPSVCGSAQMVLTG